MMDFSGSKVLITGSSRGIGRAAAIAFARAGARVAVHYGRNRAEAETTLGAMAGEGHLLVQADVADAASVQAMVGRVIDEFGGLDVAVNNAGVFYPQPIDTVDYDHWQRSWHDILQVNLVGAANVAYCAARHMIPNRKGAIINISSRGAFRGEPECPAYGASKAGMNAMSQSLARKLAPYGIGVFAIAPGFVETDMARSLLEGPEGDAIRNQSPTGRVAQPEEVAHAILFYATPEAFFLTGGILDVNGASYLRS